MEIISSIGVASLEDRFGAFGRPASATEEKKGYEQGERLDHEDHRQDEGRESSTPSSAPGLMQQVWESRAQPITELGCREPRNR
jgi:hypothetical protein